MIHQILNILGLGDGSLNGTGEWRRRHIRHNTRDIGVQAEVDIGGRRYKIRDWSMGGLCFETPANAPATVGDMDIHFRLPGETVTIRQAAGRLVRSVSRGMATEFSNLTPDMRRRLEKVLDMIHTQRFLESQMVVA
jgi:hypothetical protein